ncbi:unnamed protein product [Penicillium camemberti]|uniref:Str. FM013 n=1 Tax=Penicillium camemberti (strain FM 013) TaxID=1429867 RepID=A0A0G4PXR1_PENC3|nr:unnamed protein product [Penicillium camemberti]
MVTLTWPVDWHVCQLWQSSRLPASFSSLANTHRLPRLDPLLRGLSVRCRRCRPRRFQRKLLETCSVHKVDHVAGGLYIQDNVSLGE